MATWFSPEGLMHLNPRDEGADIDNDNGILFRCFYLYLKAFRMPLTQSDLNESFKAIKSLEVEPGLFARRPNKIQMQAHDDYVGICGLSVIHDLHFAREIVWYGLKTGFHYNNVAPQKFEFRTLRQGGEICFYKLCAGLIPTLWESAWLIIGLIFGMLSKKPSVVNLAWLRIQILKLLVKKNKIAYFEIPVKATITVICLLFDIVITLRGGIGRFFDMYYRFDHPIRLMGQGLYGD